LLGLIRAGVPWAALDHDEHVLTGCVLGDEVDDIGVFDSGHVCPALYETAGLAAGFVAEEHTPGDDLDDQIDEGMAAEATPATKASVLYAPKPKT
jgi:hypothetical protein